MNYPIIVFLTYFFSLYSLNITASDTEYNENKKPEAIQIIDGQPVIFLDDDRQQSSGLETIKLKQIKYQPEIIAYGKAISPQPLLTIRNQYLASLAQQMDAKAHLTQSEKNISRLRNLHKNEAISSRKLLNQQTQWQSDKAIYNTSSYQSHSIINSSRLQWGKTLTQWVTANHSEQFNKLINGETILLRITLPVSNLLPPQTSIIFINPTGERGLAFTASFISQLPQIDAFSQGFQYVFQTNNSNIKTGMNFTAWIPQKKNRQTGVIIPESSLAWHLGQAFVFIKIDEDRFIHRNINNPIKVSKGYFIAEQITEDEDIVVTGTQMLLSHEFRSQIPDEDEDD